MNDRPLSLGGIAARAAVAHTVTYFVVGLLAFGLFDYSTRLADPAVSAFMRSTDDPLVQAGVLFQPVNNPRRRWLNWVMGALACFALLLPALGLLAGATGAV